MSIGKDIDVIEKFYGTLGPWQIYVVIIASLVDFPGAWNQLNFVFLAPSQDFFCLDNRTEQCAHNCTQHSFDKTVFTETIISQWDLVCQKAYLADFAEASTMLGVLVGSVLFGHLSDRFGRRPIIIAALILQIITGIATAFVPWFGLFLALCFLTAVANGGSILANFTLVTEIVGCRWRATIGILYKTTFILGRLTLPLFAYFLRDWRLLQLGISTPAILLIFCYWGLPESPRWLLNSGKVKQAMAAITEIAIRKKLPTTSIQEDVENYIQEKNHNKEEKAGNILDLIRTPIIRMYTICVCFTWFSSGLGYFGISQYIGLLGGNIYVNVALSAIITIPSIPFLLWACKAWGRRRILIFTNIIAGISGILIAGIPREPAWIRSFLCGVDMCALTSSFSIMFVYTSELYPTLLRNVGLGTTSMCTRIGSILAPFIVRLGLDHDWITPLLFGILSLMGILFCLRLPETANCKLPDSIKEVEDLEQKSNSPQNNP